MALFSEEDWEALRRIANFGGTFVLGRPQAAKLVAALEEAERRVQASAESALARRVAELQEQLVAMDAKLLDASPEVKRLRDQLALRPAIVTLQLTAAWDADTTPAQAAAMVRERLLQDAGEYMEMASEADPLGSREVTGRLQVVNPRRVIATAAAEIREGQAVYLGPDGLVRS